MSLSSQIRPLGWTLVLLAACALRASQPNVTRHEPLGGQRGAEIDWKLFGERIESPQDVLFYAPGFQITDLKPGNETGKVVTARLKIPADAKPGPVPFRLRTQEGLSTIDLFFVGAYPSVKEVEPNNFFDQPQTVSIDSTVEGVVRNEDVDYYKIEAKKGERISVEIEAMRLGRRVFDPYVAILDTNRFELAFCDDSTLLMQDAFASAIAPYDGAYLVEVRETSYSGADDAWYRVHIGRFARPVIVSPTVGKPGEKIEVTFLGDPLGDFKQTVQLGDKPGFQPVWPERDGTIAPSPNLMRVSSLPAYAEQEPNHERGAVTNVVGAAPCILTGTIGEDGDVDWFRIRATKGHVFNVQTYARRLRAPFDAVVAIYSGGKEPKRLEGGDDKDGPDPQFKWTVPEDGEYLVSIRDHLRAGGPDCVYQIAFESYDPELGLYLPEFKSRTQQKMTFTVPRGGRAAGLMKVRRENIGGDVVLEWPPLPEGVTVKAFPITGNQDTFQVMFEASTNAPLAGVLLDLPVRMADTNKATRGSFDMRQSLVYGDPGNAVYSSAKVDKLAVAVTETRPYRVWIEQPPVPVVPGGNLTLQVKCERSPGFEKPIKVRFLQNPPSIAAANEVVIGKTMGAQNYRLSCSGGEARTWPIAVISCAEEAEEQTWSASDFVNLEVASPYLSGELVMTATVIGKNCEVICKLNHLKPWTGEGKIELAGLPAGCKAEPRTFTTNDTQVVFQVTVAPDAPQGQHKSLFCDANVPLNGAFVQHSLASGGTLRIDPPPPAPPPEVAKKEEGKPAAPAAPPPANAPVLSRLEQLRLQQKAKGGS